MTRDTMTGGDWALCVIYTAIWLAVMAWLIAGGLRETSRAAEQIIAEAAAEVVEEAEHIARQAS